jgi:hypothetical protein
VSPDLISSITAELEAEVTAWKTRRLDAVWPIVCLDGIVVHVRGDHGRVSQHTMYVALGVNLQGLMSEGRYRKGTGSVVASWSRKVVAVALDQLGGAFVFSLVLTILLAGLGNAMRGRPGRRWLEEAGRLVLLGLLICCFVGWLSGLAYLVIRSIR